MGLELKPSKTRIAHTFQKYEEQQPGFDFLGYTVRQFPAGKYQSGKNPGNKKLLGFKTLIKPSTKKLKIHTESLGSVIKTHKAAPQEALISRLNPIIRGWANYYSTVVSKKIFSRMDKLTYQQLRAWSNRRHPKKDKHWIAKRYWLLTQEGWNIQWKDGRYQLTKLGGWVFANKGEGKKRQMRLRKHFRYSNC